jgi:hypothetical protein
VTVRVSPVAGFRAVTVAPATTAPFGSVTVPFKSDAFDWAKTVKALKNAIITADKNLPTTGNFKGITFINFFSLIRKSWLCRANKYAD